ncbi:cysteine synthase A [Leeuwenhoekiella aestuarii]|uniref:N-(2-amino-2-carboxyethyl)-L-glutamate synthase n=1 Tax=Leeuwenhoekiella aestuarii TaxID=2249426 RepID=A0A4Q0NTU9_9FLAO|nr:2,3-diaminopropionate biosynthesis protein SbnA [Leeuwenhoekiella aestuarii]RXG13288.1 cysteine synthase A [Leeuwenhoekiella aestuarii]RXG14981.1 cysteine synthase A [Leeuwenhoekiella aestuarii]
MNTVLASPRFTVSEQNSILNTIGNTPLIHLKQLTARSGIDVFGKLEMANPGGSIKDRTSLSIVEEGIKKGEITPKTTLVESSSGNMAIGLAQVCGYYNIPLVIVVDPKANNHTLKILKAYGVQINTVNKPDKKGGYLGARLNRVKQLLSEIPQSLWTNQYGNRANPHAHYKTMSEITSQLPDVDYVFSATSTCGTLMGCATYIKENNLRTKLIAVDACGSVIFGDAPKERFIPGHGAGLPSQFLNKELVNGVMHISDKECVEGCQKLLKTESILAGGSSGAVVSAFLKRAPSLHKEGKCVLILCDRGERYLDTIYNEAWVTKHLK